jgi:hypothetical protein
MRVPGAHISAAERLVATTSSLALSVPKNRVALVAVAAGVAAALAVGLALFTDISTGPTLTATLVRALGITGGALRSTMNKAIGSVEPSLMAAEVHTAIGEAITVLPKSMRAPSMPDAVAAQNQLNPRGPDQADLPRSAHNRARRRPTRMRS